MSIKSPTRSTHMYAHTHTPALTHVCVLRTVRRERIVNFTEKKIQSRKAEGLDKIQKTRKFEDMLIRLCNAFHKENDGEID